MKQELYSGGGDVKSKMLRLIKRKIQTKSTEGARFVMEGV